MLKERKPTRYLKEARLADLDNLPEPTDLAEEIIENIEASWPSLCALRELL